MTFVFAPREQKKAGKSAKAARIARLAILAGLATPALTLLVGCERDAFIDPSVVGRWEVTPTTVPILERLVAIEGPAGQASVETTPVRPEDLIPEVEQYRLGPGDSLEIRIQDLFRPDTEEVFPRVVDSRGYIDLPRIGRMLVDGLTEDQVRDDIIQQLRERQILVREPVVSVVVSSPRRQTYNILGGVNSPGLFGIPRPDFRLLEAITAAGRFNESVPHIYVIRYIPLTERVIRGSSSRPSTQAPRPVDNPASTPTTPPKPSSPPPENLIDLIDELAKPKEKPADGGGGPAVFPGVMAGSLSQQPEVTQPAKEPPVDLPDESPAGQQPPLVKPQPGGPARRENGSQTGSPPAGGTAASADAQPDRFWVFRDGKWIQVTRVKRGTPAPTPGPGQPQPEGPGPAIPGQPKPAVTTPEPPSVPGAEKLVTQRVIEVPMAPLLAGSAQFNIIVRPGDIIRIPTPPEGFVYIGGEVNRPGVFGLPTNGRLTVTRAIVASGNLSSIAIPERMDLTRMIGQDRQATIRVNYRAIAEGTMPDIFLKPDDVINVGTNFWAYPLAVIRSGFRASYGYGFILDRNFDEDVFGPRQSVR